MNARDELAEKVFDLMVSAENMGEERRHVIAQGIAAGLESAGWSKPRTITTEAEWAELPHETVIRDAGGLVFERWYSDGHVRGWMPIGTQDDSVFPVLPATVLFTPGGE